MFLSSGIAALLYIVALFCPSTAVKKCREFEGELISIGEDLLEVMGEDVGVVKLMDSPMVEEYTVEKTDQPVVIMFRNNLPVIYDGVYGVYIFLNNNDNI